MASRKICATSGLQVRDVSRFVYATTYVTNLIVEEKEASVALLTTEGFRDVLEIGRASRKPDVYDIHWRPAPPLVPRHLRFVVKERMDYTGTPIVELDEDMLRTTLSQIKKSGVRSLAVCLLHAYANPAHELRIGVLAKEICPDIDVSLSSEVVREFREYERTSTTCVNAFIKKAIGDHLSALKTTAEKRGMEANCYIMRGNGGLSTFERASELAVSITHSGVMGGIVGATALAAQCGVKNIITLDMGGTSTDVALITNGSPTMTHRSKVGPYPLLVPTLDMVTIGAGGGSLAFVEGGSALRVGPRSAGSVPGPACYGQGGDCPTVTDANLLTGRLNPDFFLAGKRKLYPPKSKQAIADKLAGPLGITPEEAAVGILSIAEAHMTNAIRLVSVERGLDPRDFTLVAFGGAGALHAVRLAEALGISKVLIPPAPGNLSAMGLLCADVRHDLARTLVASLTQDVTSQLRNTVEDLLASARLALQNEGVRLGDDQLITSVDLRYQGQNYELNLPLVDSDLQGEFEGLISRFGQLHERVYGYLLKGREIQLVNVRVTATGSIRKASWPKHAKSAQEATAFATRQVYLEGAGWTDVNVFRFLDVHSTQSILGPAVVEYPGSTLFLAPAWKAEFDEFKNAHLTHLDA